MAKKSAERRRNGSERQTSSLGPSEVDSSVAHAHSRKLTSTTDDSLSEQGLGEKMRRRGRALRIVVADDDHDTVDMLAVILRDEGHIVQGVYSGKDVLPAVRTMRPNAVILDISVPGMSGYAVAQEIRYSFTDAWCPLLIAISGVWKEHADIRIAHQVGFDAHLLKPCDPEDLLRLLRPLTALN